MPARVGATKPGRDAVPVMRFQFFMSHLLRRDGRDVEVSWSGEQHGTPRPIGGANDLTQRFGNVGKSPQAMIRRSSSAYLSSLVLPIPLIDWRPLRSVGFTSASASSVASEKTTNAGTLWASACSLRHERSSSK